MTNPAPGGLRAEALSTRLGLRPSFALHFDYDTQDDAGSTLGKVRFAASRGPVVAAFRWPLLRGEQDVTGAHPEEPHRAMLAPLGPWSRSPRQPPRPPGARHEGCQPGKIGPGLWWT